VTENYPEALATNASPTARTAIVVLGAGSGTRLKEKMPKAAVDVHGKTLLYWALERARASGIAERIVVTVPTDCAHRCPQLLADAAACDGATAGAGLNQAPDPQGIPRFRFLWNEIRWGGRGNPTLGTWPLMARRPG